MRRGAGALLAELVRITVALGDGPLHVHDLRNLVGGNEDVKLLAEERLDGEAAADEEVVTNHAIDRALVGDQGRIIDLRQGTLDRRTLHRDLVLTGQIGERIIVVEELVQGVHDWAGVYDLLWVKTGGGGRGDVARDVAAGPRRGQSGGLQAVEDGGHLLDGQPVELDGLAGRDVGQAAPIVARDGRQGMKLFRRQAPTGDLDAHHEVAVFRPLLVDALPLEPHHVIRINGREAGLGVAQDIVVDVQPVLLLLDPLFFDQFAVVHGKYLNLKDMNCPVTRLTISLHYTIGVFAFSRVGLPVPFFRS